MIYGVTDIQSVKEYALTSGFLSGLTATKTTTYSYGDSNWKDKLTSYNGKTITYDAIGNPLTYYNGSKFVWQNGRELAGLTTASGTGVVYAYNADGIRTRKTVNGVTTSYTLEGDRVVYETNGTDKIWYYYDASGTPVSFELNGTSYHYVKNLQGDIIAIVNDSGAKVVEYTYNSWGKLISTTGSLASTVGVKNPYRYRSYRYDTETGLYYLQSRYYDPEIGRFINADSYVDTGETVLSTNMFAYCENNPINKVDFDGHRGLGLSVTKGIIFSTGYAYLRHKGWTLSAMLYKHFFYGYGKTLSTSNTNKILNAIKKSKLFKDSLKSFLSTRQSKTRIPHERIKFHYDALSYNGEKQHDLHYAVGKSEAYVDGYRRDGKWYLTISVSDKYDFNETYHLMNVICPSRKATKGDYIYSVGTIAQFSGMGRVFQWSGKIYYSGYN